MENRKVRLNQHTNLLELEEHMYPLVDVDTPNVFRNLFHYDEIPKIAFNDRIVPHNMPDEIWITDTTFRDGQQSRAPYTTEQIVTIYDYFHRLGGPNGKIRQSEFFLYSKKDRDAVYKCLERGYQFPEVTSWIRASKKDFQLVKDIGLKETGILVSCSDYHIFYKLKMTRREAMEHYLSVVRECMETGVRPRCHLEDITRSDIYGFVIPFCLELMKLMEEYQIPVKIRVCDTMGYGVNFPGAVIPRSIPGIIYGLMTHAGVPSELIEFHGHNDFYKAVNNSTTAWLYGACGVNCSLFGIGERTGNTPLEAMVFEYAQLRGTLDGMDTRPTTDRIKETLFNMISAELYDSNFLDLFSGSGGIGIEALSRGAANAVFVEKNPKAMKCIQENLESTKLKDRAKTMQMDVFAALSRLNGEWKFEYIFMDPPYNHEWEKQVLEFLADTTLLADDGIIIVEASKETDLSYAEELGYSIIKEKMYKTNKHIFLEKE